MNGLMIMWAAYALGIVATIPALWGKSESAKQSWLAAFLWWLVLSVAMIIAMFVAITLS